jgi:deaminated glutathione amidase
MVVIPLVGLVFGIMNCYDLRFPEMGRALIDRGATALVVPAHFIEGPGKAETWSILLRARAIENDAYVVAAGKPGPECVGHSMVVDPLGVVLASLDGEEEGLVTAEISNDEVLEVRTAIPVLKNRRFAVRPKG